MTSPLRLDSTFAAPRHGSGSVRLRLVNAGQDTYAGFRIGFTSFVLLTPPDGSPCRLVERVGSYHEVAPVAPVVLGPGDTWESGPLDCEYQLVHANDGPVRAFLIAADGSTAPIHAVPTERGPRVRVGADAPPALRLDRPSTVAAAAWAVAAGCEARLHPDDALVLASGGDGAPVDAAVDGSLGAEGFLLEPPGEAEAGGSWTVRAGSPIALQWAFMEAARRLRSEVAPTRTAYTPRTGFRALMVDLARHHVPPADVEEVLDQAAWRRLNRVHLHLTDDQAWRLTSPAYPALTEVGAWRGHGLAIPPQNGSGAAAYGGAYTAADVGRWVAKATELGIELIPEVDVPGHCFAAIASLPELRDPDDTGTAASVHHFRRNVLNPGLAATWTFLEVVFGEVADLFPSPWIHIGADEVAEGAWDGSPAAQRYAAERGVVGSAAIEVAFVRDIRALVAKTTGRTVGAWLEPAAEAAAEPGDGYLVGWRSGEDCRRAAEAGHRVVASPAHPYYLDMATGRDWRLPGMWWAGPVTAGAIEAYDPTEGWSATARDGLLGIQACLWAEHVPDRATLRALLLPRLDAFGAAGWTIDEPSPLATNPEEPRMATQPEGPTR